MMPNVDRSLVVYARLAAVSQSLQQLSGRDRLLVLTIASACEAGYPAVAETCRRLVLDHNPQHLLGRFDTAIEAMRSPEFRQLVQQNQRLCSFERAEHLLSALDEDPTAMLFTRRDDSEDDTDAERVSRMLSDLQS